MAKFPERLKQLRKEQNWTQDDVAKRAKMSRSTIAMFEKGTRDPSTEMLDTLADIFNVDMNYLMGKSFIKRQPSVDYMFKCGDLDLETITFLSKLNTEQTEKLLAVAKAMFPEVK